MTRFYPRGIYFGCTTADMSYKSPKWKRITVVLTRQQYDNFVKAREAVGIPYDSEAARYAILRWVETVKSIKPDDA